MTVQAHDYAIDLPEVLRHGDILIVAVGRAELVKASWVKPGAVVIDVGINVVEVTLADHCLLPWFCGLPSGTVRTCRLWGSIIDSAWLRAFFRVKVIHDVDMTLAGPCVPLRPPIYLHTAAVLALPGKIQQAHLR